jgi:hypothetical protein
MTRVHAEILILVINTLFTGTVMFVAGALKGVMNDMDVATFKQFVASLQKNALRSPYVVIASSITFLLIIPYFITYGFVNWWFIAGMISCLMASISSKVLNLPIYKRIGELDVRDTAGLNEERRKMGNANAVRAVFYFLCVVLTVIGFF